MTFLLAAKKIIPATSESCTVKIRTSYGRRLKDEILGIITLMRNYIVRFLWSTIEQTIFGHAFNIVVMRAQLDKLLRKKAKKVLIFKFYSIFIKQGKKVCKSTAVRCCFFLLCSFVFVCSQANMGYAF